jgi:hypothetical protein
MHWVTHCILYNTPAPSKWRRPQTTACAASEEQPLSRSDRSTKHTRNMQTRLLLQKI